MSQIQTVVFDLGGVLIDWNPRYLFRGLFVDSAEMENFLKNVCTMDWNEKQDEGRDWSVAVAELSEQFPHYREAIYAYHERWEEMLKGPIEGTVQILQDLKLQGYPLFALSNWSEEKFPHALARYPFLRLFQDILLSGREKIKKPDPRFFRLLVERHGIDPTTTVFIDDVTRNIEAAKSMGFQTVTFRDPQSLAEELLRLGLRIDLQLLPR